MMGRTPPFLMTRLQELKNNTMLKNAAVPQDIGKKPAPKETKLISLYRIPEIHKKERKSLLTLSTHPLIILPNS